jgi:hypothetical protein
MKMEVQAQAQGSATGAIPGAADIGVSVLALVQKLGLELIPKLYGPIRALDSCA